MLTIIEYIVSFFLKKQNKSLIISSGQLSDLNKLCFCEPWLQSFRLLMSCCPYPSWWNHSCSRWSKNYLAVDQQALTFYTQTQLDILTQKGSAKERKKDRMIQALINKTICILRKKLLPSVYGSEWNQHASHIPSALLQCLICLYFSVSSCLSFSLSPSFPFPFLCLSLKAYLLSPVFIYLICLFSCFISLLFCISSSFSLLFYPGNVWVPVLKITQGVC